MITKELALTLRVGQELWHNTLKNKDGTPLRARVNGKCETWKREPSRWKLPMKYGLHWCFTIWPQPPSAVVTGGSGHNWSLPDRWAIERHWKD